MGKCQSQPGNIQNDLQISSYHQNFSDRLSIPTNSIFTKINDNPTSDFAQPVNSVLQLNDTINKKLKQLGPFDYNMNQNYQHGKQLGPYKLQNGSVYLGEWKNGKPHGQGKYYLPDHSFFQGISKNGEIQGIGRIIHQNGDYFEGSLKQSKAQGQGTYVQNDITYKGMFKNNLQHGEGHQFSTNYEFKGQFIEGFKKQGKLILKNKGIYEYTGGFRNNKFHGKGILLNDIGTYEGEFYEGVKQGYGKFTWNDGSFYEGQYLNDEKHGQGRLFDRHHKILREGKWERNRFVS